jgi:hypothetical protein
VREKDIPLIEQPGSTPFGSPVIDLAEVRIRFGKADLRKGRPCEHRALIYSRDERRVWCEDCERTIDSFDAFMTLTTHFHTMERAATGKQAKADEALARTIVRRAAKVLDKAWGKMAPLCPHCRTGLLPEDFADGFGSAVGIEIERARRKRASP